MADNMILFSTMYDQNSNNEDVDGDTVIHDGEGADGEGADGERADGERADGERAEGERADGERADVESGNSDDIGTEPQGQVTSLIGGVEKEADDRIEPQGHDLVNMKSSEK